MSGKAKGFIRISFWQLVIPKIIAFIFSLMCVGIFFIEGIHIEDDFQPILSVIIFLFWDFFWMIVLLKWLGIRVQNQ